MSLEKMRGEIDAIDEQILALVSQRARVAIDIGHLKASKGRVPFAPAREIQLTERLQKLNSGPLPPSAVKAIFREVISACRNLERPLSVAYLGPPATWSHLAAIQQFGASATYEPVRNFSDVFAAVETSRQDFGVVPVENSTAGSVGETLDNFAQTSLTVCAEIYYQIHFSLLSSETDLKDVRRIYSLPIAAEQCRRWVSANLPHAEVVDASGDASSTARAAQLAAAEPGSAAIASRIAAEMYGLNILQDRIEDSAHNRTRFFVLGHHGSEPSGRDKTSVMFALPHRPGSLSSALECLERGQLNMTMINSRPTKQMAWEYVFFVDIQGHAVEEPLASALRAMSSQCAFLRVLGSYPEASPGE